MRVGQALAEGMEPDHGSSKIGSLGKRVAVGRERHAQPRSREVLLKACGERRICGDCGDVGDQVLGGHFGCVPPRQCGKQARRNVGCAGAPVAPQRENAAASPVIVVKIRDQRGEGQRRAGGGGSVAGCGQINLLVRARFPELRVGAVDHSVIGNDPLPIKGAKAVADRLHAAAALIGDGHGRRRKAGEPIPDHPLGVPVTRSAVQKVRMK